MASSDALTELKSGPLYFFDQPTRPRRIKGTHWDDKSNQENVSNKGDEEALPERLTGKPDTSPAAALNMKDRGRVEAYKRAAPRLLSELAALLSHDTRPEAAPVPRGVANILSYSWQDLAAGATPLSGPGPTHRPQVMSRVDGASGPASASDGQDAEQSAPRGGLDAGAKRLKRNSKTAAHVTTPGVSVLSISCKSAGGKQACRCAWCQWFDGGLTAGCDCRPGWVAGPEQQAALCQWVVERLQAARNPERIRPSRDALLLLRHYGNAPRKATGRKEKALVNGLPEIPDVRLQSPAPHKLHYRIDDGSSFIYYPSGGMAVCQSHSGRPGGGFYTNVFSDSRRPAFLATVTASGRGAVTHPLSASITALWDQDGGFTCDPLGNITEEWRWTAEPTLRGKVHIQVSDLICVRLFSGTSALLTFRCNDESVHLPLCGPSPSNRPKEAADAAFACSVATEPLGPAGSSEHGRSQTLGPTVREPEEPSAPWRRGGRGVEELRRLQRRVRGTLDQWLAWYRRALGVECPGGKRLPDAPARTGQRGEGRSAALPSLNPLERTGARPERTGTRPERTGTGPERCSKELRRHAVVLTVPADGAPDTAPALPRTRKRGKEGPCVTRIGPLQIHGNIQLESVIIPMVLESPPPAVSRCPAPLPSPPSAPLALCPVLLRAALLGEGGRRRCRCSSTRMPALTDLEYDAFVTGQPAHSRQILVVCVTGPGRAAAARERDPLEQLYRRRNRHRAMPCTQCQMDSFRLVRYETAAAEPGRRDQNVLLQQRHNAAPGMVLMYIRGTLLFVGYIFSDHRGSVINLQEQISRARAGYRSGVRLPADHKFSDTVDFTTDARPSRDAKPLAAVEKQKAGGRHVAE
ncbi:uncharacterized protein LOC114856871 isoform X3 [Betta splendens]|uniref:Uncharacterized protein LOC114856871 isoform X3 n=1 Tax=Betta splendens TaxID=158456 RepID=A0A6P7MNZ0_BETSP|nr:uncharacterized protein LOC114856871 isoform X3 [Betta splendens]